MLWKVSVYKNSSKTPETLLQSSSYIECFEFLKRAAMDFISFRKMGESTWYTMEWYAGGDGFKVIKHYVTYHDIFEFFIEESGTTA